MLIVSIVMAVLGSIPLNLAKCLSTIDLQASLMQKIVLLSSVQIDFNENF